MSDQLQTNWLSAYNEYGAMTDTVNVTVNPVYYEENVVEINEEQFNYSISDIRGVLWQKGTIEGNKPIDVSSLAKGIYFFEFYNKNVTFVEKIIKM